MNPIEKAIKEMLPHLSRETLKALLGVALKDFNGRFGGSGLELNFKEPLSEYAPKKVEPSFPVKKRYGPRKTSKNIVIHGKKFKSLAEAVKAYDLNYANVSGKVRRGASLESVFPKPLGSP